MRRAFILSAALALSGRASAGLLTPQGAAVLDSSLAPRPAFTDTERITFQQKIHNGAASPSRTVFRFVVLSPSGNNVFDHAGNAVPGAVGFAASQVSGVSISQFYRGPGSYTFQAEASLDGQVVLQQVSFTVSSPNILLIYPPNGAQGVADIPLTFRWSSSGGSRYKVTVGDNPSLYNAVFSQDTAGSETFLSYPENPSDPRQRLAAGQLYYWKVEGFDAAGLKVAESQVPFSFAVAAAPLTRDIAVTDLKVSPPLPGGLFPFEITVKNQGGVSEVNIPLKFSVGGLAAPGTPITMPILNPAEQRSYPVSVQLPADQSQSLAIACVEFSDNNIANNCKTMMVSKPPGSTTTAGSFFGETALTPQQLWDAIREILKGRGQDLSDFRLVSMEGDVDAADLRALLDALRKGEARVTISGPPVATTAPGPSPSAPGPAAAAPPPAAAGKEGDDREWSGLAAPAGENTRAFVIRERGDWEKIWNRLSGGKVPKVDFKKSAVAVMLAGRGDRADRLMVEEVVQLPDSIIVRFKLSVHERLVQVEGARRAAVRETVPFLMKVVANSSPSVQFEKIED